jgi:restriction system protein
VTRLWMVRLGKYGEQESHALAEGELVTGWEEVNLTDAGTREAVSEALRSAYPEVSSGTLQNWAAQLNQFRNAIAAGDLVVTPMKTTGQVAIGRIVGAYSEAEGGHPARNVEWLRPDVPRDAIKQDLLYSLGATQTVCEISRNDALRRIEAVVATGRDPGPNNLPATGAGKATAAPSLEPEQSLVDLARVARDQIERHIASHFAGHAFTQLIAAILRAQGYQTQVSPAGADRGIDILAGQGALGFNSPRLVVQVKSGGVVTDQPTLQSLIGCIADTQADQGLLVSWSGFTSPVRQRANELYFRVRMWGREEIITALFSVYDQLPEEVRAELPLRRIWSLVPEDSGAG